MGSFLAAIRRAPWRFAWEWVVPIVCIHTWYWCLLQISPKAPLWVDEIITRYLVTDHSPLNMLGAVAEGADGSPPAYWLTMWVWQKIAGATPLALRVATTTWVSVAVVASWATFRRRYGFHSASIATFTTYFLAPVLWNHAFEARHYGQLVGAVATMNLTAEILFDADRGGLRGLRGRWPWIANAAANALVVNTHLFGFFYAGCTLLAFALADLRQRRLRWKLWASFVAGWLTFLPWLPSFRRQLKSTEWGFWVGVPKIEELTDFNAYIQGMPLAKIALVLLAFGALALVLRAGRPATRGAAASDSLSTPAPIAGFFYVFLVPTVVWWLSVHRPTSVWLDRYMSPQFLGWTALVAVVLHRMGIDRPLTGWFVGRAFGGGVMLAATFGLLRYFVGEVRQAAQSRPAESVAPLDTGGMPVAAEHSHPVLTQWYYAPNVDIYYLIDAATAKRMGDGLAADYHIMVALAHHYPVKVLTVDAFLAKHSTFLHVPQGSWLDGTLGKTFGVGHHYTMVPNYRAGMTLVTRDDH